MDGCEHIEDLPSITPSSPDGCSECQRTGDTWVRLRVCLLCGEVGCCNDSKNRHASAHAHTTGHAVIQSYQPGEAWRYCFVHERMLPDGTPFRTVSTDLGDPTVLGPEARRVVRSYYAIAGTYTFAASLIWGVNTLFLLQAGLDIFEVFVANTAFTFGTLLFELPTGILADTRGRRASFLVGVLVLLVTTLGYVGVAQVGGGLLAFVGISILVGLGFTFFSGATDAWLVDALTAAGHRGPLDGIFARGAMVTSVAMFGGSIGGGALGTIDLSLPYVVRAAVLGISFLFAWMWMEERGFTPRTLEIRRLPEEMRKVARESLQVTVQSRPLQGLVAVRLVQWAFLMWAWYAWQPYLLALWGDAGAVWLAGVISALMSVAMIGGNLVVDWLARYCGRRTTLLGWSAVVQVAAAVLVGLTANFWVATLAFLVMIGTAGVSGPVRSTSINLLVSNEHRASVLSLDSMLGSGGSIVGQTGLGWLSRAASIADAFVLGGIVSILQIPIVVALRRLDDTSDFIVGARARERGTCATEGAPASSQLDG